MKIGHLYCVTGQREILRRLERTIAAQLCVDAELGQKHPAKRVLITDVEPSTLPDGRYSVCRRSRFVARDRIWQADALLAKRGA